MSPSFLPLVLVSLSLITLDSHAGIASKERPMLNKKQGAVLYGKSPNRVIIKRSWRDPSEIAGNPRIEIVLSEQMAFFYKGDERVGETSISSGMKGFETKLGTYKILQKEVEHASNLYGSYISLKTGKLVGYGNAGDTPPSGTRYEPSPMPYFMRLSHAGLGLHAGFLPGFPASHGCIRLPDDMAKKFFEHAPLGTQVDILP